MGAKGNKFWEERSTHGRSPIFSNSDDLWDACTQYFQWVSDNPLYETKVFHNQGEIVSTEVPLMRAMTMSGMCIYLGIGTSTWADYRNKDDFSEIVHQAEEVIRTQKFEGASANLLNSNIIARDLGLSDKQNVESTNTNLNQNVEIDKKEYAEIRKQMLDEDDC